MVRKLTMAVALALGSASFHANGLGLGDIETNSGLNEPFRGKIGLLSVGEGELEGLRVRLASIADFERAGVGRPLFLSSLRFEPKLLPGGRAVIEVSSDFPIREPFLNFLIEVNWPKGRLIREYTVLLDPPVTTTRRPPPVTAPSTSRPSAAAPSRAVAPRPAPEPVRRQPAAGEYGPVQANETMWTIASNLRPSDVSTEQMILAIQRANPDAFINGNVNLLKKGQILRIPGRDEILSVNRREAREQFLAQQEAWLLQLDARAAGIPGGAAAAAEPEAQLRIATPRPDGEGTAGAGEDDAGRPTSDDLEQELIIARERAESARQETDNLRSQVDDLEQQIGDMQRLLSLKDEQLAQLQASVQQQQEASVQPDEAAAPAEDAEPALAQLPAEPDAAEPVPDDSAGGPAEQAPADETGTAPVEPQVADTAPATEPATEQVTEPPLATAVEEAITAVVPETTPVQEPQPEPAPPPAAQPEPPAEPVAEPTPAPKAEPPQPAWYEQWPVIGGIAAVVVLLLGWLFARGRKSSETADEAPLAADETLTVAAATAGGGAALAEVPLEPDTQELAEAVAASQSEADSDTLRELVDETEVASDLDAVQDDTGEVDPVSEADVYIAYGRYQQAEDLLRQALDNDPDRLAYKHKLLEVLYATKKAPEFVSVAQTMVDGGQDGVDPEAWVRIQEMGRDLEPDSQLFQPGEMPRPKLVETAPPALVDDGDDHVDELSELVSELKLDDTPISEPNDMVTEADLSLELDELTREVEQSIDEAMDVDSGDVTPEDLESLELDLPTVQADKRTLKEVNDPEDLEHDTFELPENSLEVPTQELDEDDIIPSLMTEDITRAGEVAEQEMDSDLENLSELTSLDTQVEHASDRSGGLEPLDLTTVFDKDAVAAGAESVEVVAEPVVDNVAEVASGAFDVGDEATVDLDVAANAEDADGFDDVETKLDLARAYVEMGDAEGARSILEEVKDEGDDQQKSQANQILAEIEA